MVKVANLWASTANSGYFVDEISKLIDIYSRYKNVIILVDFKLEPGDNALSSIIHDHDLYNMIKNHHVSTLQIDFALI